MSNTEIYATQVDFTIDPTRFAECYSLLPEVRKAKVDFYAFYREKVVALATGLLIRWSLEQRLHRPLKEGELAADDFGKPYLQGEIGIHFNVSHAGEYVVCAVAGREVGLDIEMIEAGDYRDVARLVFNPLNFAEWEAQPAARQLDSFYHLWTLRESFSKAVGLGFSLDAKNFFFSQADDSPDTCRVNFTRGEKSEVWDCRHYHCFTGYKLALCLQGTVFPEQVNMVSIKDLYKELKR